MGRPQPVARGLGARAGGVGPCWSSRSAMPAMSPRSTPRRRVPETPTRSRRVARRNGGDDGGCRARGAARARPTSPSGLDVRLRRYRGGQPRRYAQRGFQPPTPAKAPPTCCAVPSAAVARRDRSRLEAGAAAGGYEQQGNAHGGVADRQPRRLAARARAPAGRAGDPQGRAGGPVAPGGDDRHRLCRDDRTTEIGARENQPGSRCSASRGGGSPAAAPAARPSPTRAAHSRAMVPETTPRPKLPPPRTLAPRAGVAARGLDLNLPNLITLARLAVGAAGDLAGARRAVRGSPSGCSSAPGMSDAVDGYIAKHFDRRTPLGAVLDPAADKALLTGLYVTLFVTGQSAGLAGAPRGSARRADRARICR